MKEGSGKEGRFFRKIVKRGILGKKFKFFKIINKTVLFKNRLAEDEITLFLQQ
jgi:hypothetical protein